MQRLSLSNLTQSDDLELQSTEMNKLNNCLIKDSFCLLIDHGINKEIFDNAYLQSELFHSLPHNNEIKQAAHYRNAFASRGWSPEGEEPAYSPNTKATCSAYDMCYEMDEIDEEFESFGPNHWPPQMPEFKIAVYDYYLSLSIVEKRFASCLEELLKIEKGFISSKMTERSPSTMRLIYYPAVDKKPDENLFGISAHTDYEVFTFLTQRQIGSQVQKPDGEWIEIESDPYEIILMIGDMTEVMTNGKIKATPHRVPPTKWERYSITRFCAIDGHHIVEPLKQFIDPDIGPKYKPVSQIKNITDGLAEASANTDEMKNIS
jgi:isopenicillin N synthase-like dioxygenase